MARDLLSESRKQDPDHDSSAVYAVAANVALGEIMERWSAGLTVSKDARVENVHVHDGEGNLIGFRLYLVSNEPMVFGTARIEVLD